MPFYSRIKHRKPAERRRTAQNILKLQEALDDGPRQYRCEGNLVIGTWNIRHFGSDIRQDEALHYIAEVIAAFDVVALQEVKSDLEHLKDVMKLLGPGWDYIVTDVTAGKSGNSERQAFVFDTRTVRFTNEVGEIVLPEGQEIVGQNSKTEGKEGKFQFARTPFMVSFQSGWFKFNLCTVHMYFGKGKQGVLHRTNEIKAVAEFFGDRNKKDNPNILLGDFNIIKPQDATMKALTDGGYTIPDDIASIPEEFRNGKFYDQIAFPTQGHDDKFRFRNGGVVRMFETVYRQDKWQDYRSILEERKIENAGSREEADLIDASLESYFRVHWRTYQMSDHLPLWVAMKTDFSQEYLQEIAND